MTEPPGHKPPGCQRSSCGSAAKFGKRHISGASERAFPVFLGDIFGCSSPFKKRCFNTQEFTCFLSTVSLQRRATRSDVSFQTKRSKCLVTSKCVGSRIRHSPCCTLFLINNYGIEMVLCAPRVLEDAREKEFPLEDTQNLAQRRRAPPVFSAVAAARHTKFQFLFGEYVKRNT